MKMQKSKDQFQLKVVLPYSKAEMEINLESLEPVVGFFLSWATPEKGVYSQDKIEAVRMMQAIEEAVEKERAAILKAQDEELEKNAKANLN
jgi:hypothetical protein